MDFPFDGTRTLPACFHRIDGAVPRPRLLEIVSGASDLYRGGALCCRPHSKHTADFILDSHASDAWTNCQPLDFADLLSLKGICNA